MTTDFIVVGQGLAGTLLAYNLLQEGKRVVVIDQYKDNTASRVAAGLYNPITGQRTVKSWLVDQLFPFLETHYAELEQFLGRRFLYPMSVFRPFQSVEEQNNWFGQSAEPGFKEYVEAMGDVANLQGLVYAPFGGFFTKRSGFVDVPSLLEGFALYMESQHLYLKDAFDMEQCVIAQTHVEYKGIHAAHVVFCRGEAERHLSLFGHLPLNGTKGQVLDVTIQNNALKQIISKGVFILPYNGSYRVGATYEWTYSDDLPTEKGREEIEDKLSMVLQLPYQIVGQRAGLRPTVKDRKPLLGTHPVHRNVHIFNGLGTKGVSLAPYFAGMMARYLTQQKQLLQEVDIQRFAYLYHSTH